MSTLSLSGAARRGAFSGLRSRRPERFALQCEPLESRQLLAVTGVNPTDFAPVSNPSIVQPNVSVAPLGINTSSPTGLSPSQILAAYGVNQITFSGGTISGNGQGQTIAIVDAYYDPNIQSDLGKFDAQFGLSAPPSFTQHYTPGLSDNPGWALETSLDVEWAHAIAPDASILLVESAADVNDLLNAVTYATQQSGVSVVSMSWGSSEFKAETSDDSVFTTPVNHIGGSGLTGGITFVASSGDDGSAGAPEYPSVSPNVLAVGGTTLNVTKQGSYVSESGWSDSGGGYSKYESEPSYQTNALKNSGLKSGHRTTPDVSWDANPSTGVSVYDSVRYDGQSGWFTVGGTSVGAPSWAGLIAIADQGLNINGVGSLSDAQSSVYQLSTSDFHDITTGSNGYKAGPGYDLVTGIGTPIANKLVPDLVTLNTSVILSPPALAPVGTQQGSASVSSHLGVSPAFTIQTLTLNGSGNSSSTTASTATSSTSITALTPNTGPTTTVTWTVAPVILVPVPLPPPVIHLGSSTAPATAQSSSTAISLAEEQPTSLTHFGQGPDNDRGKLFEERPNAKARPASWIDIVEPLPPDTPADAPKGEKAPPPAPGPAQPLPVLSPAAVDAVFELFDSSELTGSIERSSSQSNEEIRTWSLSALLGATTVVVGGYRLAIHGSDRASSQWLPRRAKARRWIR